MRNVSQNIFHSPIYDILFREPIALRLVEEKFFDISVVTIDETIIVYVQSLACIVIFCKFIEFNESRFPSL